MKTARYLFFALILVSGIGLVTILFIKRVDTPLRSTLAPLFQLLGEPVKAVDEAATKVMPIDDADEEAFGHSMASYYKQKADTTDSIFRYVNNLVDSITQYSKKPFPYRVYILSWSMPNACALPGGIILVTRGLLEVLETEGELVSVLAHEMGHIECGHCMRAVKFELLAKKMDMPGTGMIADFLNALFLRHAYSKTQEAEADAFAYAVLLRTTYTPSSVAGSFSALQKYLVGKKGTDPSDQTADVLRDYFMSHPPLALRVAKYDAEAKQWWKRHQDEKRYTGRKNLLMRVPASVHPWDDEWTTRH